MDDIFNFWAGIKQDARIHPEDEKVFSRLHDKHNFNLDCLPGAYFGPLKTAPVVLLFLSPGYDPHDTILASNEEGQEHHAKQRTGLASLPTYKENPPHYDWWSKVLKQFGINPNLVNDKIAILNIGAYHSKTFKHHHMLSALPSSRVTLNWAQSTLFKEAEAGERIVVCLRSAKYWGLELGKCNGGLLYAPLHNRRGRMHKEPELANLIIQNIHDKLGYNKQKDAA